jgi:hypothetical protein
MYGIYYQGVWGIIHWNICYKFETILLIDLTWIMIKKESKQSLYFLGKLFLQLLSHSGSYHS